MRSAAHSNKTAQRIAMQVIHFTVGATLSCGMGIVVKVSDPYRLESDRGAIVLTLESEQLEATAMGISTPARILGQRRPGEELPWRF
jgi:hypothetical protein